MNLRKRYEDAAVRLTAVQALDAKNALDALAEARVRISLTEVVRAYLNGVGHVPKSDVDITVGKAFLEYYEDKETSKTDHDKVMFTVGRWVENFGRDRNISEVSAKEVLIYLQANFINKLRRVKSEKGV